MSPSIEAVNEFHVSLSGLPADLGRTTGGITNFNTKSGSNDYHGSVYDFFKNAALDANSWFNNGDIAEQGNTAVAQAEFKRPYDTKNDYGINLGGPVRIPSVYSGRDKTFFFFNWEQLRYNYGGAITSLLPTPAELGSAVSTSTSPPLWAPRFLARKATAVRTIRSTTAKSSTRIMNMFRFSVRRAVTSHSDRLTTQALSQPPALRPTRFPSIAPAPLPEIS